MLAQTNSLPKARVEEMLDIVGLTDVADRRAGKFSLGMGQRLGIAAAMLGDPEILLFDEPINGLDPDGIRWVRNLLRRLAGEGRTVFVSSHLMSEMALTAHEVLVIGRGRLITQMPIEQLTADSSRSFVRVRSPQADVLRLEIEHAGGSVSIEEDGSLSVRGVSETVIGERAAATGIVLHELAPQAASLEEAFMELTNDSVEFRGEQDPLGDREKESVL
jgi:ABC-2 type transport system ATP-binding protein